MLALDMVDSPELRWSFIRKVCTPSSPSNSSSPLPWPPSMSSFAPSLTSSFPPSKAFYFSLSSSSSR
ncbi:hypothetical protein JHK85_007831 [Glycine max]|nr:hypothetical protein JHK85_007831 [Glycine max]